MNLIALTTLLTIIHLILGFACVFVNQSIMPEIPADELGFSQREGSEFHDFADFEFGLDDLLEDGSESHRQRVRLLLQQRVTLLSAFETGLHDL